MGLVVIEFDVGLDIVYVLICFLLGKNGCEGCVCLYGMFGGGNLDMGLCLVVMICFGFDNGVWGCEYVDLWLNCMVNDVQFDLYQVCVLCIGYGGCVLVGDVKNDDGNLWLQVDGNVCIYGMSILGGLGSVKVWVVVDEINGYFCMVGNVSIGFENVDGFCDIFVGGVVCVCVLLFGCMLIGMFVDDGCNIIQVVGSVMFKGVVILCEMDVSGVYFCMIFGDYGVFLCNDGINVYFLLIKKGDLEGQWNDFCLFVWLFVDGMVWINGNGVMIYIGGEFFVGMNNVEVYIRFGFVDGYIYGNIELVGWWGGNIGLFQYFRGDCIFWVDGKLVWYVGNFFNLIQLIGFVMLFGVQIFVLEGMLLVFGILFINDGKLDIGLYYVNDGLFGVMCNLVLQILFMFGGIFFQIFV